MKGNQLTSVGSLSKLTFGTLVLFKMNLKNTLFFMPIELTPFSNRF